MNAETEYYYKKQAGKGNGIQILELLIILILFQVAVSGCRLNLDNPEDPGSRTFFNDQLLKCLLGDISLFCDSYKIEGKISGLTGGGLQLQNNGQEILTVESKANSFSMQARIMTGKTYNITVLRHPSSPGNYCTVSNGIGVVNRSNVTDIRINCVPGNSYGPLLYGSISRPLNLTGKSSVFISAAFNNPSDIAIDGENLYVSNNGNGAINRIRLETGAISEFASGFGSINGMVSDGKFLYVCDASGGKIWKILIENAAVSVLFSGLSNPSTITMDHSNFYFIAAPSTVYTVPIDGGVPVPLISGLSVPVNIGTDGSNIYIDEYGSNIVSRLPITAGSLSTFTNAISNPKGFVFDGRTIYLFDQNAPALYLIPGSSGAPSLFGLPGLNSPRGAVTDGKYFYILNNGNGTILKVE